MENSRGILSFNRSDSSEESPGGRVIGILGLLLFILFIFIVF